MKDNFEQWLNDNSITEVECLVPDLGGIARGKILPTNKFIKGLSDDSHRLPQSILYKQSQVAMLPMMTMNCLLMFIIQQIST